VINAYDNDNNEYTAEEQMQSRPVLIAAFLLGMTCLPSAAQQVRFTFATTNGLQDLSSQAILRWKGELEKRSKEQIRMDFSSGGALGGDQELLQQLATNEVQMHVAGPVVVHRLLKEYQCLEAEYVYQDEPHGLRVWTGSLGKEVSDKLKARYGIEVAAVGARGARHVTANKPIRELKGIKVRVTNPLRSQVFSAYGALPGPLPVSELYGALRQGVFDAQENPIPTIYGDRLYEVQKTINLTGHVWSYNVISANSKFLASLKPDQRKLVDETLKEAIDWLNQAVASETDNLVAKMKQERGTEVLRANTTAFRQIALPIVEKFAQANCRPGLLDDVRKAAN
jgi:tripartite ATP-independent transporter DctP family solute receptor